MFESIVRQFLYHPVVNSRDRTPPRFAGPAEELWLDADDGNSIHGLYWPAPEGRPTILFFHGNAQSVFEWCLVREDLEELECGLLLIDYPGYGKSSGAPSEEGLYTSAHAAYRELTEARGVEESSIVIMGKSLGGGVATELASRRRPLGLILESTFCSIPAVARRLVPLLPVDAVLTSERYDSIARIAEIRSPILVIHGTDDELIPVEQGRQLFEAATSTKELYLVSDAGHNDVAITAGREYGRRIRAWLDGIE